MSKVKLIVCEGNGTSFSPYLAGSDRVIDLELHLPENENIIGIVRTDFDKQSDGTRRASDDLCPVIPYEAVNGLVGKLLTLIDATFSDKSQREAMKDLFKQIPWDWYMGKSDSLTETWRKDKFPNYKRAFELPEDKTSDSAEARHAELTK